MQHRFGKMSTRPVLKFFLLIDLVFTWVSPFHGTAADGEITWDRTGFTVPGYMFGDAYAKFTQKESGYHAIVWEKGHAARQSLFTTPVPDSVIYHTLVRIGGLPGDNLTLDTWDNRNDPKASGPRRRVQGSRIHITVRIDGDSAWIPVEQFFLDPGGRGIEIRFGGNLQWIPRWGSGCVLCLFSCPGGKVSNAAYSVRDYVETKTHFTVKSEFRKNGPVEIHFALESP